MSIVGIRQRVSKLETSQDSKGRRQHVLEAFTEEEADRKQAELIASGVARPNDLFVIIRRFALKDLAA
ncbi:hypothetical protein [Bosea sp. PAMC 26642]|uniref:hypothetical protein n=1 Tax=Bosea sp. (strain PAMC 26642) TaxID=1792307 RepID=UPI00076FE8D8|nr:hypothetical protein [Bosea sp. PAMC 26642]AMJ61979.1 hypothetical protein AXW83_18235 [Bosea sp. PAMC 26642]